jgi:hypothetical protein
MANINLTKEKEASGKIQSFAKGEYENPNTHIKSFFPVVNFESGDSIILFHTALKNQIGEAVKDGLIDIGTNIAVKQGIKIMGKDNEYYQYDLYIEGGKYIGNNQQLDKKEFLDELFN